MNIKALIFDFDGTIIDTEYADFEAWRQVFKRLGASLTVMEWISCFGTLVSTFDPIKNLSLKIKHPPDSEDIFRQYHRIFHKILNQLPIAPGLLDYLDFALDQKITLAIASGGKKEFIDAQIRRLSLSHYFHVICTYDDAKRSKPHPALYQCALNKLGVSPGDAIAFEDSPPGVEAAQSANIFCVGVRNGINIHLPPLSANMLINSFTDLPPSTLISQVNDLKIRNEFLNVP